ncbi:MAG: riboflavin biosynthesis protein RibF [Truepera sp.]|nr:riboflavin biosynthesis protein RibF [Truepera sp.]
MNVLRNLEALKLRDCILCIGNFDGVHLGHQLLLAHMQSEARQGHASAVITFDPPAKVVFSDEKYLTSLEEKLLLIAPFQPAAVVAIPFDHEYARTDKAVFLAQLRALSPHTVIVGEDFRFGHQRAGGLDDLSHITHKLEVFGMKRLDGVAVKSSHIRQLLQAGRVEEAKRFLGHPYLAIGPVIKGDQRGRQLGFPTANVALPPPKALPLGVFAVSVETPQGRFGGMANVGPRPSFPAEPPALEVHLFDFEGDLYGQQLTVWFEGFIRQQQRFFSLDELKSRLAYDAEQAKALLARR